MYVCMYVCMNVCMYVCMHVCVRVCKDLKRWKYFLIFWVITYIISEGFDFLQSIEF